MGKKPDSAGDIRINKHYQRKGYAREALRAVVDHAFRLGAHRVYAECDPRNEASWRLWESAGFRREAHFRQNIYFRKIMSLQLLMVLRQKGNNDVV